MPGIFGDITTSVVQQALGGLSLRQQVTSNNVANVDTPGFKASRVTFEDELRKALETGGSTGGMLQTTEKHLAPGGVPVRNPIAIKTLEATMRNDGNSVDIEREMATLAETSLTYSALTRFQSQRLGILRTIINEGRR